MWSELVSFREAVGAEVVESMPCEAKPAVKSSTTTETDNFSAITVPSLVNIRFLIYIQIEHGGYLVRFVAILAFLALVSGPLKAAELVMLEQTGCYWCEVWEEEIGVAYPKTEEGVLAPLRKVDIWDPWPEDLAAVRPERMTPTFILVEDGKEVARLRGYPGEHFFWPMLGQMIAKLQPKTN